MAKTFEALKQAKEDKGLKINIPPLTLPVEEREPALSPFDELEGPWVLPTPAQLRKFKNIPLMVEEFQRIKYRITHLDPNLPLKTILFCSPTRREGNSTVLTHFSHTLAAEGSKVLLIDGNLRNPNLHKAFHLPGEKGLTEIISDRNPHGGFDHFIKDTGLENLYVITSGSPHPNPGSILESDNFGILLNNLKVQWDWVLIDSPAITSCSDSNAVASKVDGIILVIQAEKTRWQVGQEIRAQLENCGGRILGVILNKRRFPIPAWVYKSL